MESKRKLLMNILKYWSAARTYPGFDQLDINALVFLDYLETKCRRIENFLHSSLSVSIKAPPSAARMATMQPDHWSA